VSYKAEYIWIDGTEPTAKLRSKTKILADGAEPGVWGFDGSSTNQAEGHSSDRVLKPVATYPDPIRGGANLLVLCEVFNIDDTPHSSNTRALLRPVAEQFAGQESLFGIEQEYTFFQGSRPLGFPEAGYPAPQGGYYCGDWNGAGAHTNFSTKAMREGYDAIIEACEALGRDGKPMEHIKQYGSGVEARLTGAHETAPWSEYSYGVSDRGASVRIPWQVEVEKKGYIEDRRPNANVDPYVVTRLIVGTCCSALEKAALV